MSLQDNHNRYENRLLGLTQDGRNSSLSTLTGSSNLNIPNGNDSSKNSIQRKCSSTPEDFNSLYGSAIDNTHHHTPAHTPPNRLNDHNSITGEKKRVEKFLLYEWIRGLRRHVPEIKNHLLVKCDKFDFKEPGVVCKTKWKKKI